MPNNNRIAPVKNPPVATNTTKPFPHHRSRIQQILDTVYSVDTKHRSVAINNCSADAKHYSVDTKHRSVDTNNHSVDAKHYSVATKHCSVATNNRSVDAKHCSVATNEHKADQQLLTSNLQSHLLKGFLRIRNNTPKKIIPHHINSGLYVLSRKLQLRRIKSRKSLWGRNIGSKLPTSLHKCRRYEILFLF